ncbi:SDR family oxidoreductase [Klebsiella variicola subsp. variicola]|uniref:SDR family NAD(P)-dependent oxidoreductase n=1 Tax=Klebsiella variicola TaxID=244366 RepID=UPI001DF532DF|nr:SDR family oxidoreductase [Klebsiella variicola]MCB8422359.1 SDR family oxidoreductase [Klebsiella variicola subsp. variicola]MCB8442402.1 SDR family oxidoreductase [Klebsiella variicola subsp. variicola]MCB8496101.1 SDR family oxidoreductase [Klebsiella variicola subsp. variicola]
MKTFLSIGSGPGMGMATASRFAGEGFRVILSSRNKSNVASQADQLRAAGFAAEGRVADASDITSIAELIREVEVETGGVDVLHFNAAAMHDGNLETQSVAGFIQDLSTHIGAVYAAIKAVTPRMAARGEGAILLTGGMFATQPHPEYLTLSIGKAGLLNLTHGLFPVLKAQNIHLSIVTVGAYVTPGSAEAREIADLFWQQYRQPSAQWTAEAFYPVPHHQ